MRSPSTSKRSLLGLLRRHDGGRAVDKTDSEWRDQITPEQYRVLRGHGTERPFSGAAINPDERGMYRCAGCDAELFRADTKFDPAPAGRASPTAKRMPDARTVTDF